MRLVQIGRHTVRVVEFGKRRLGMGISSIEYALRKLFQS